MSGKAELPTYDEMRREYEERVRNKGLGREFHSLKTPGAEEGYVRDLVDWVNADAERLGISDKMIGHTREWHMAKKDREARIKLMFGNRDATQRNDKKERVEVLEAPIEMAGEAGVEGTQRRKIGRSRPFHDMHFPVLARTKNHPSSTTAYLQFILYRLDSDHLLANLLHCPPFISCCLYT